MSPKARGWLVNLLRVAITAIAVAFVIRMIHWEDYWVLDKGGKKQEIREQGEIRSVETLDGGRARVLWADGHATEEAGARKREGFLSQFSRLDKPLYVAMLCATCVTIFLLSLRWWLLLRGYGFPVPLGKIFYMTYAGAFFNNFLPGSVGGDLTKAILAATGEERKAAITATVILDRFVGLAVMILLAAVSMIPEAGRFWAQGDRALVLLVYALLGAMILGLAVYYSPPFRFLVGLLPFKKIVGELDGVFRSAWGKKSLVAQAAGLSLAAQICGILTVYGTSRAMGIPDIGVVPFFIFEPIIFIVTAVPLSVGGWGVQEYVYQRLFGDFGGMDPNQAIALSVLFKLNWILTSLPGGVLFAVGGARRRAPDAAAGA